jgi:hypothetical protein
MRTIDLLKVPTQTISAIALTAPELNKNQTISFILVAVRIRSISLPVLLEFNLLSQARTD